jgi:hypothetical protein
MIFFLLKNIAFRLRDRERAQKLSAPKLIFVRITSVIEEQEKFFNSRLIFV